MNLILKQTNKLTKKINEKNKFTFNSTSHRWNWNKISCESDDICPESTATTPSLIINVFDVSSQEDSKDVVD